jgi:hypothetical protein
VGVVLLQELPHLSHLGVRARQVRTKSLILFKYCFVFNEFHCIFLEKKKRMLLTYVSRRKLYL